jgi:hypothetical protein
MGRVAGLSVSCKGRGVVSPFGSTLVMRAAANQGSCPLFGTPQLGRHVRRQCQDLYIDSLSEVHL